MKRFAAWSFVVGLALLVPVSANAQKDNKYTKEASKYIVLALAKADSARPPLYQQALAQLQEGLAKDPKNAENAKVWLLLGQAYVGLNRLAEADSALDKAVAMHPEYAAEIAPEREQGWMQGFNTSAELMAQGKYPEAVAALEQAHELYNERPEGFINLGVLYLNQSELDKAEAAFTEARRTLSGPLAANLDEEQKAQWASFDVLARIAIAQLNGQRGVNDFQAREYATAIGHFEKAIELNPHARDYTFNLAQSIWAQASALEAKIDSLPAAQQEAAKKAGAPELIALYEKLEGLATKVAEVDPYNEVLYIIRARARRMLGEYSFDPATLAARQAETVAILQERENLPFELSEISVNSSGAQSVVRGTITTRQQAAGSTVALKFTLVGIDGQVVGEQVLNVTAPEKDQTAPFEGTIPVTGDVAAWKYSLN